MGKRAHVGALQVVAGAGCVIERTREVPRNSPWTCWNKGSGVSGGYRRLILRPRGLASHVCASHIQASHMQASHI